MGLRSCKQETLCLLCESREMKLRAFGCCSAKAGKVTEKVPRDHRLCMHYRTKGFRVLQAEGEAAGVSPVTEY